MHNNNITSSSGIEDINLLAEYFSKMYNDEDCTLFLVTTLSSVNKKLSEFFIRISFVNEKLFKLDLKFQMGCHYLLLNTIASYFPYFRSIFLIFRLKSGIVPVIGKQASLPLY